jgi:large subunit ribosomal protein L24
MSKIKKNDEVLVIAGRDKGKRGQVIRVLDDGRALVQGINMVKKNERPNPNLGKRGGIVDQEAPIQLSNLAIWNAAAGKADKIGYSIEDGKKVRVYKSSRAKID